jgi:aminodeoxyfutalosine synthase
METMNGGIGLDEARALLAERDLIAVGARGDEERRRRHGTKTTFVRVLEVRVEQALGGAIPPAASAGEVRIVGRPASFAAAAAAVAAVRAAAGTRPVTAFSLADLLSLAGGSALTLAGEMPHLASAGLETIAEAPLDLLPDPVAAVAAARGTGVMVPRLTVHRAAEGGPLEVLAKAREVQASAGGVLAFAPLARASSVAQPSTGYDDVKTIAVARLVVGNVESIQVDWALYGPKLAQFALTVGADDVDGVSPLEGDLGRRRSPIEEIRGNVKAAGLEPVERDGLFRVVGK